jgi:hypothetical protein
MDKVFSENGLIILGFGRDNDILQGKLEVCHYQEDVKFYRYIPTQENYWVHITNYIVEPIYGCKVVDFRNSKRDDGSPITPVYLVYLSDLALLKYVRGSNEYYWFFKEGRFVRQARKEWLLYYNIIPGVEERGTVVEPPPTPEKINKIISNLLYKETEL